ncbi:MAG: tetratricopeptide repeat-containing sensor histidine kinase [Bacteroidota bacterium]
MTARNFLLGTLILAAMFVSANKAIATDLDSLEQVIEHSNEPEARLSALLASSWQLKNSDTQMAWEQATEALGIAHIISDLDNKALAFKHMGVIRWYQSELEASRSFLDSARYYFGIVKNDKGLADIYNNLGLNFHITGDFGSALANYEKALQIRQQLADTAGMTITLINMGVLHHDLGDQQKALSLYNRTVELLQLSHDEVRLADTYINIGNYYLEEEQFSIALRYFDDAQQIFAKLDNQRALADALINKGDALSKLKQFEKAAEHYRQSLKIFTKLEDLLGQAECMRSIGLTLSHLSQWDQAKQYLYNSQRLSKQIEDSPGQAQSMILIGELLQSQAYPKRNLQEAINWLERANALTKDLNMLTEARQAHGLLADIYAERQEHAAAFAHRSAELKILKDNYDEDKATQLARIESMGQIARSEIAVEKLENEKLFVEKKNQKRSFQLYMTLIILSGIMIFLGYLFYSNRQKQAQNLLLQKQNGKIQEQKLHIQSQNVALEANNAKLEELNQEKNYLMGVVAHDLKNPLSQIKGLVNIIQLDNQNFNDEQQNFLGLINQSADRLTEMIHQILDVRAAENQTLNFAYKNLDLQPKVAEVTEAYNRTAKQKNITLNLSLPDTHMKAKVDEQALHQILDNLISNAIKFSPRDRKVDVSMTEIEQNIWIKVTDQGPGMTEEDKKKLFGRFQKLSAKPTGGESSNGIGLSIVKKYVEAMDGKVWCESVLGEGTTFIVSFPLLPESITVPIN